MNCHQTWALPMLLLRLMSGNIEGRRADPTLLGPLVRTIRIRMMLRLLGPLMMMRMVRMIKIPI